MRLSIFSCMLCYALFILIHTADCHLDLGNRGGNTFLNLPATFESRRDANLMAKVPEVALRP